MKLRQTTSTLPQQRFWASEARYRCFAGGAGSGKTTAGVVECLRMPSNSQGLVISPTFRMLSDSTGAKFLDITKRAGILATFAKSNMNARLINGTTIRFRSADTPDALRGLSVGWAFLDEAALMDFETWQITLARLREPPGKAWACSTPRGLGNWLYSTFVKNSSPDYEVITSATTDNQFLPPCYIASLQESYTSAWLDQEVRGLFVDVEGSLFKRSWFQFAEYAPPNLSWFRFWDLATTTKTTSDYSASVAVALAPDGTLFVRDAIHLKAEWPGVKKVIVQTMINEPATVHGIEEVALSAGFTQELRTLPEIAHVALRGVKPERDKVSRALGAAARCEAGKLRLVRGDWNNAFIDECCSFPNSGRDDLVDSLSGGTQMIGTGEPLRFIRLW